MPLTPSQIDQILDELRKHLETPTAEVESTVEAGCTVRENWNTGFMERTDNGTRTMTLKIKVKGGAHDILSAPIGTPETWPG